MRRLPNMCMVPSATFPPAFVINAVSCLGGSNAFSVPRITPIPYENVWNDETKDIVFDELDWLRMIFPSFFVEGGGSAMIPTGLILVVDFIVLYAAMDASY
ncbi:hypothetical protein LTR64_005069 [Lithohypha guttulata]|uniref:uncharacterized protein n=1 Tax=Lithohypha guttulata TaxID=1690604 RepID=UPI002DE0B630|nr:hypothetical protein LTR51_005096 [Lithohypha guttulata]